MSILFQQIFINWLSFLTVKKAIRQHVQKKQEQAHARYKQENATKKGKNDDCLY